MPNDAPHAQVPFGHTSTSAEPSDAELLARVGTGDRHAFDCLYERFARPVLTMSKRQLGNDGSAEDAAQETFVSVWRSARTFDPARGSASAWLYTVARNAIIDRARQRHGSFWNGNGNGAIAPNGNVDAPEDSAAAESLEDRAEAAWLAWRVHSAIEQLPERERDVVKLGYWHQLSQAEIAARLDLPLGTVKSRTRKALSRLAVLLEEARA